MGAPDFERTFSTYPDFDKLQARVASIIEKQNSPKKSSKPRKSDKPKDSQKSEQPSDEASESPVQAEDDAADVNNAPKLSNGDEQVFTQPDGSPITEEYLVNLEMAGYTSLISQIAANNDECSVP